MKTIVNAYTAPLIKAIKNITPRSCPHGAGVLCYADDTNYFRESIQTLMFF